MKDELVRRAVAAALSSIVWGLSGCNGCHGCEGQTVESTSIVGQGGDGPAVPNAIPSSAQIAPNQPSPVGAIAASVNTNPEHDPTGVRRCCKTINENLGSAPDKHKATWKSALETCNQAVEKQTGRKGLEPVREILTPVGWPAACQ